jgi:hypothetical protein
LASSSLSTRFLHAECPPMLQSSSYLHRFSPSAFHARIATRAWTLTCFLRVLSDTTIPTYT